MVSMGSRNRVPVPSTPLSRNGEPLRVVGRVPQEATAPSPRVGGLGGLGGMLAPAGDDGASFLGNPQLSDILRSVGQSMLTSPGNTPLQNVPTYLAAARKERQVADQRNRTVEWLRETDPEVAGMVEAGMDVSDAYRLAFERKKLAEGPEPTAEMRNFMYAQQNPDFAAYSRRGLGGGDDPYGRAPTGYRWTADGNLEPIVGGPADKAGGVAGPGFDIPPGYQLDPADPTRVVPIAGGPAEKIDGELAARIGLSNEFLNRAPGIRERIQSGEATGPVDVFMGQNVNSSTSAGIRAELEYGTEALVRMLTGAGMNMDEARERARRYLPTYTDDTASLTRKFDDLTSYLTSTIEVAGRGRGGTGRAAPSATSTNISGMSDAELEAIANGY